MLTQSGRPARHAILPSAVLLVLVASCDKVPLLAPTGTVITLFPGASTIPIDGNVEIIATVIENGVAATTTTGTGTGGAGTGTGTTVGTTTSTTAGAGTPVQNGTLVSFTTTIGRIEPSEARTNNGQVKVRFIAGGQSGTATITAYSGGASGKIENLLVGTAAAERLILTASPQTLGASGGASVVSARVETTSRPRRHGHPRQLHRRCGHAFLVDSQHGPERRRERHAEHDAAVGRHRERRGKDGYRNGRPEPADRCVDHLTVHVGCRRPAGKLHGERRRHDQHPGGHHQLG